MTKTILPSLDLQPKLGPRAPTSVWTRSRRPTRRPPQPDQALTRPCDRPPRASPHPRRPSRRHRGGNPNMLTRPPNPRNQTKHMLRAKPKEMQHRIPCSLKVWGGRNRKRPQPHAQRGGGPARGNLGPELPFTANLFSYGRHFTAKFSPVTVQDPSPHRPAPLGATPATGPGTTAVTPARARRPRASFGRVGRPLLPGAASAWISSASSEESSVPE